jgi:hypothetical protein
MFEGGEDVAFVAEFGVALEAANGGDAEAGDEVRIFAIGFFDATPAGFTGHVNDGSEGVMRAAETSFERGHSKETFDEVGVEGGAERDGLGEAGAIGSGVAVQAFFVEHDGNAEAAVLKEEFLNGVGELGHGAGFFAASGIAGAADLTETAAIAKGFLRFG